MYNVLVDYFHPSGIPTAPELEADFKVKTHIAPLRFQSLESHVWETIQSQPLPPFDQPLKQWIEKTVQNVRSQLDISSIPISFIYGRNLRYRPHYACVLVHFLDFYGASSPEVNLFIRNLKDGPKELAHHCESVWIHHALTQAMEERTLQMKCATNYHQMTLPQRNELLRYLKLKKFTQPPEYLFRQLYYLYEEGVKEDSLSVMYVFLLPKLIQWERTDYGVIDRIVRLCHMNRWYVTLTNILTSRVQKLFSEDQIRKWRQDEYPPTCQSLWVNALLRLKCIKI
jgi:hypothetical protein